MLTHLNVGTGGVVVTVVVADVVTVVVGVVEVVSEVVSDDVTVVVADVVMEEVAEVVGVVTSQFRNPPAAQASVMPFIVAAVAAQSVLSNSSVPNAQLTVSSTWFAGPLNSLIAALRAAAVASQSDGTDKV